MGFFDTLRNGFELTKASIKVIMQDPEFLILPIISGIVMIGILITFVVPLALLGLGSDKAVGNAKTGIEALSWIIALLYYFAAFIVSYLMQATVLEGAKERFAGRDPQLVPCFSKAMAKIDKVATLAAISAVVSVIAQIVRNKGQEKGGAAGLVMQLIGSMIGASWSIVAYFSLPVILNEDLGVMASFKRSMEIFGKTWGTNAVASLSLIAIYVPGIVGIVLGILAFFVSPILGVIILAFGVIALFAGMIVGSVAKAVIAEALYEYAATGKVPAAMPTEAVKGFAR